LRITAGSEEEFLMKNITMYCSNCKSIVYTSKGNPRHLVFLIFTFVTAGLVIPVWLIVSIINNIYPRCDSCYKLIRNKRKIYNEENYDGQSIKKPLPNMNDMRQIDGILYVFAILILLIIPLQHILGILLDVSLIKDGIADSYAIYLIIEIILSVIIIIFSFYVGSCIFKKTNKSIRNTKLLLVVFIARPVLLLICNNFVHEAKDIVENNTSEQIVSILLNMIFAVISIIYLKLSERVKKYYGDILN
jgi:hypothetical protein